MNIRMIKEVLEEISTPTGISYSGDRTLSKGEVKCILDYIEELQQERNQFKEYTNHNYDEGKKKQQRIDKAIEYIEKEVRFVNMQEYHKLLEILKGGNND